MKLIDLLDVLDWRTEIIIQLHQTAEILDEYPFLTDVPYRHVNKKVVEVTPDCRRVIVTVEL